MEVWPSGKASVLKTVVGCESPRGFNPYYFRSLACDESYHRLGWQPVTVYGNEQPLEGPAVMEICLESK